MQFSRVVAAVGMMVCVSSSVSAQPAAEAPLTPMEVAVACAPPTSFEMPANPLRILGGQDTVTRSLFAQGDTLVIGGGIAQGLEIGQQYFIRRPIAFATKGSRPQAITTVGWLHIVAVNETTAIGALDRLCNGVYAGDYLEPYVRPTLPADADRDIVAGEPDFSAPSGRVMIGTDNNAAGGRGNLMLIDQGTEQGLAPGARFAVFRNVRAAGMPLATIGEGIVISAGKTMSVVRITRSRDAVVAGDYVVPRK